MPFESDSKGSLMNSLKDIGAVLNFNNPMVKVVCRGDGLIKGKGHQTIKITSGVIGLLGPQFWS
jgi:hypothetical protein